MNDFIQLFKDLGTPLGILSLLIYAIARVGKFMAPMVRELFQAHIGMVDAQAKSQPLIVSTHDMTRDIHDVVVSPHDKRKRFDSGGGESA